MKKITIAANWKMNLSLTEAIVLTESIIKLIKDKNIHLPIVIIPPYIYLYELIKKLGLHSNIFIGAQNLYPGHYGAITGEISALMLYNLGVKHILIGHSERRNIFQEKHILIKEKLNSAIKEGLIPIFWCGENILVSEKESFEIIHQQMEQELLHLKDNDISRVVIAYEPTWAIGTGITPSIDQIYKMHKYIRTILAYNYGESIAQKISILYGGSCNLQNSQSICMTPEVDGLLIGGASLTSDSFCKILENTLEIK